jgi:hypothetical protein
VHHFDLRGELLLPTSFPLCTLPPSVAIAAHSSPSEVESDTLIFPFRAAHKPVVFHLRRTQIASKLWSAVIGRVSTVVRQALPRWTWPKTARWSFDTFDRVRSTLAKSGQIWPLLYSTCYICWRGCGSWVNMAGTGHGQQNPNCIRTTVASDKRPRWMDAIHPIPAIYRPFPTTPPATRRAGERLIPNMTGIGRGQFRTNTMWTAELAAATNRYVVAGKRE